MNRIDEPQRVTTRDVESTEAVVPAPTWNGEANGSDGKPDDFAIVSDQRGTRIENVIPRDPPRPTWWQRNRKWVIGGVVLAVIMTAALWFGVPLVKELLNTVSTDDAFVAGHVTYVGPRVQGVITRVAVDENDRVEPGDLLASIDREPFAVAVAQSQAKRDQAKAEVIQARTQVQSQIAQARASYYRRKNAQEKLREQIASLRARVATLHAQQSSMRLAEVDQQRIENLTRRGSATQSELDDRNNKLKVAEEQVEEARAAINEVRAALGLAPNAADPLEIPADLETRQSTIQSAISDTTSALAQIGIQIDPKDASEAKSFEAFLSPEGGKAVGEGLEKVIDQAPGVRVAAAALVSAERDLDDASLKLSYTEIRSEISGYVQDRSVHPGNQVAPGQSLLSIRPDEIWIEANYKETQIQYLRIGQPVDLEVDAYPDHVFKGRVAGFRPGTGLSESLLPPENATGNYVKVTQRLPVRIDLVGPNPEKTPLFIGLSVVPKVRFKEQATGPGAGRRLHAPSMTAPADTASGPAGVRPRNEATENLEPRP